MFQRIRNWSAGLVASKTTLCMCHIIKFWPFSLVAKIKPLCMFQRTVCWSIFAITVTLPVYVSVVKWCRGHSCAEGATCVDQHRFAQCLCPPGFTGQWQVNCPLIMNQISHLVPMHHHTRESACSQLNGLL